MTDLPNLATVERLAIRLGVTLAEDTLDYARAEEALWTASTRARSITEREWADAALIPDEVVDVVLAAAMRIYRNPDRFLANQSGTFSATLPTSDLAAGDVFLLAERRALERHRPKQSLWVSSTTRDDDLNPSGPYDPANYVTTPVDGVYGDPFYLGPPE